MIRFATVFVALLSVCADANGAHERILNGQKTSTTVHPYQVSIRLKNKHMCGGTILSNRHIITAAHCFRGHKDTPLGLINVHFNVTTRSFGGQQHSVQKIYIFPMFDFTTLDGDVAMVELDTPITFNNTAKAIQRARGRDFPSNGEMLTVVGWGITKEGSVYLPEGLLEGHLPKISTDLCRLAYKNHSIKVTDNMICAGGGAAPTPLMGDSGGPLVNKKKQLVGIVSWIQTPETARYPSVFTNINSPRVHDFIESVLNREYLGRSASLRH